jgi:hypothetical protein
MCALPRHLYLVRQLVLPSFKNSKNVFRSFKKLKQKLDVVMTYPKSMENRKTKLFELWTTEKWFFAVLKICTVNYTHIHTFPFLCTSKCEVFQSEDLKACRTHCTSKKSLFKHVNMTFRNFKIKGAELRSQKSVLKITNTEVPIQNDYLPFVSS